MSTNRPSSFATFKESLWAQRKSYDPYRERVKRVIGQVDTPGTVPTSPAVTKIMQDIDMFRNDILFEEDEDKLRLRINEIDALRLARIPAGNNILVIFQGGADVKFLNDELVGPELTNVIIEKRDELTEAGLQYFGLAEENNYLYSNHKTDRYWIGPSNIAKALGKIQTTVPPSHFSITTSNPAVGGVESMQVIRYALKKIEQDVQAAIRTILEGHAVKLRAQDQDSVQAQKIDYWLEHDLSKFKLHFGLSGTIPSNDNETANLSDRFWVDQQAEWSARAALNQDRQGIYFELIKMIDDIATIRAEVLKDPDLEEFFEMDTDTEARVLKKDIVHNLRKWHSFQKLHADQPVLLKRYQKLRRYYTAINSVDYILPWTNVEQAEASIKRLDKVSKSHDNIHEMKQVLLQDQRDTRDGTTTYFHYQGTEHSNALYVSFDAIGMGDINARDIETTIIKAIDYLDRNRTTTPTQTIQTNLRLAISNVGTKVTVAIKEKFAKAREMIEEATNQAKIYTTRGGDEWHVIIPDSEKIDAMHICKQVWEIAQSQNLRATISFKASTATLDDGQRVADHHEALDVNERNNALIKEFENAGLYGIVAIPPAEGEHTAALLYYQGRWKEVSNINIINGAITRLRDLGLQVTMDGVMGVVAATATSA